MFSIGNQTKSTTEWLKDPIAAIGIYDKLFRTRIRQGWSPELALTTPVSQKPDGLGKYLYGYPRKECGYISWNYFTIPPEPNRYTYWTSLDRRRNIHRRGTFYFVNDGKIIVSKSSVLELLEVVEDDEMKEWGKTLGLVVA